MSPDVCVYYQVPFFSFAQKKHCITQFHTLAYTLSPFQAKNHNQRGCLGAHELISEFDVFW